MADSFQDRIGVFYSGLSRDTKNSGFLLKIIMKRLLL